MGDLQDGPVTADGRKTSLFELLSLNEEFVDLDFDPACDLFILRQRFGQQAGASPCSTRRQRMSWVPYGKGKELILNFGTVRLSYDMKRVKELLEEAKPYTVSIYEWQRVAWSSRGRWSPCAAARSWPYRRVATIKRLGC